MCECCGSDTLDAGPCCALPCGHVFHYFCLRKPLSQGAEAMDFKRINFGFANCPKCRTLLSHPALEDKLGPLRAIKAKVVALMEEGGGALLHRLRTGPRYC